ncbi:MAG: MMPL family transporter [Clostridia bacterium]|nr:MMPL family transporter [Clostridia bacterium]
MIHHRTLVIILCLLLLIPSYLGMNATKVKYDILYYLPQDLDTVKGQSLLIDEFGKGAFSLGITEGLTIAQQKNLEHRISEIDHVDSVIGYASLTDGFLPEEIIPAEYRNMFRNGDARLFAVFFDTSSSSEETMEAVKAIRAAAGAECRLAGLSAIVTDTKQIVEDQEFTYVAIAVALCCIVLMLTMESFLLPFIFLICIGISILWNMGTNYCLGEISYITKAVAAVLQLGVTLDYSIFLWHAYKGQKDRGLEPDDAMAEAVHETFAAIVGSSLTTIAGFVSICFMSFTLGRDLGIVMSKGVVLGVLGTLTVLPCMIRMMERPIEKTAHKALLPNVGGISRFIARHYVMLCIIFALMIVPGFYGYNHLSVYYDMSSVMPDFFPSVQANKALEETFDVSTTHLILADASIPQSRIVDMTDEMRQIDGITEVISLDSLLGKSIPESILPHEIVSKVKTDNYQLIMLNSSYIISSDEVNRQIDELESILKRYDPTGMLIGEAPCTKDLIACTDHDFTVVSMISIIAIFVIILFVLKSISLPVLLVAVIETAIAVNLAIPYYSGRTLVFVAPILISTIQLGATVDYAILMTTRFLQARRSGLNANDSIIQAVSQSAQSILVSGMGFFAATFGVGLYSDVDIISSMCSLISRGALCSVCVVLFLLPAMLRLLDPVILKTTVGMKAAKERKASK